MTLSCRTMWTLLALLFALPAMADVEPRPLDATANDLRQVVRDVDERRSAHHAAGEAELHRRALAAHRALELARGLLADYQAELRRLADAAPDQPEEPTVPKPSMPGVPLTMLEAGDGWNGPLQQPDHIGTGFGADAHAIARWNVVPDQMVDGTFNVGVLAYHMLGIDHVAFSIEGGPWVQVDTPSLNERTAYPARGEMPAYPGTEEYWVTLDAADLTPGAVEVRAVAYPVKGLPRVLEPLRLWAHRPPRVVELGPGDDLTAAVNAAAVDGDASGVVLRLRAGEYKLGSATQRLRASTRHWLTIEPAEGVDRHEVVFTGSHWPDGLAVQHLRLRNVTVTGTLTSKSSVGTHLWLDGCELIGQGRSHPHTWTNSVARVWATNTLTHGSRSGPGGWFSRNLRIQDIGENAWMDPTVVIDSYTTRIDRPAGTAYHMDVLHVRSRDNVILKGVRAEDINAQGLFTGRGTHLRNAAVVDCYLDNTAGGNQRVFQLMGPTEHLVVQSSVFVGACNWRVDEGFSAYNVMLRGSDFNGSPEPRPAGVAGVTARD